MSKYQDLNGSDTLRNMKDKVNANNETVENDVNNLQEQITNNENDIENKLQSHKDSTTAHNLESITYNGEVNGASDGKQAIDFLQNQLNALVLGGIETDPRVSQALSDNEGNTFDTLKERIDSDTTRIKKIEDDSNKGITPKISNASSIFTAGHGLNEAGETVDYSQLIGYGQFSDIKILGNTYANILGDDGDCESTSPFVQIASATISLDSTNKVFGSNSIKIDATTDGHGHRLGNRKVTGGKYYLVSFYHKESTGNMKFSVYDNDNVAYIQGNTVITDSTVFNRVGYKLAPTLNSNDVFLQFKQNDTTALSTNIDGIMLVEITSDEYNNLSESELLEKYTYVNNTCSTFSTRVTSVGKNKFDGEWERGSISTSTGLNSDTQASIDVAIRTNFIKVKPSTNYKLSSTPSLSANILCYDINENFISLASGVTSINTPSNCAYIKFRFLTTDLSTIAQIEEGTIATEYEPYQESIVYLPEIGRSLPNGTKDEISVTDGTHTKRVSDEVVLDGSEVWTNGYGSLVNVYYFECPPTYSDQLNAKVVYADTIGYGSYGATTDSEGVYHNSSGKLVFKILKSKVDAMSGATVTDKFKAWLVENPTTCIYQLADIIVTDISDQIEGYLETFGPGTTIDQIPYFAKNVVYDSANGGIQFDRPVKQVDKIKSIINGQLQEIANIVTLAADGLSATVDGLLDGDSIKAYAPYIDGISTNAEIVAEFNTTKMDQINANTEGVGRNTNETESLRDFMNILYAETDFRITLLETV